MHDCRLPVASIRPLRIDRAFNSLEGIGIWLTLNYIFRPITWRKLPIHSTPRILEIDVYYWTIPRMRSPSTSVYIQTSLVVFDIRTSDLILELLWCSENDIFRQPARAYMWNGVPYERLMRWRLQFGCHWRGSDQYRRFATIRYRCTFRILNRIIA